jgi:hypothetical protein
MPGRAAALIFLGFADYRGSFRPARLDDAAARALPFLLSALLGSRQHEISPQPAVAVFVFLAGTTGT